MDYGGFGTWKPHPPEASPAQAADGPHAWHDVLLALSPDREPCPGFRPNAWARVHANPLAFIDGHGAEAHRLGWTAEELFGVHPKVGAVRVDCCGALMLSNAGQVVSIEAETIRSANGLTYRRSSLPRAIAPVWCFPRRCR